MLLVFFMWIWNWSNRNVLKCIILSEKKRKKKPSLRNQNKSNIFLNKGRKEGVEGVKKEKRLLLTVFLNWMKTSQFIKKKNLSSVIPLIPLKIQTFLLKLHWNWGETWGSLGPSSPEAQGFPRFNWSFPTQDRAKAEALNKQLRKQLSEFRAPPVMLYVKQKAINGDLEKTIKMWERKVEIAEVSRRKAQDGQALLIALHTLV